MARYYIVRVYRDDRGSDDRPHPVGVVEDVDGQQIAFRGADDLARLLAAGVAVEPPVGQVPPRRAAAHPARPAGLEPLLAHAARRRYGARHTILHEGERSDALFYVLSGSVTVLVEDEEGEELILAYLGPGEFFGELGLFESNATRCASVRARTECEIAVLPFDKFGELIQRNPELLLTLLRQTAKRLRAANRKLGNLAFVDVSGRIARALLDLAADSQAMTHPDGMLVRITREELGRLVNCSRQVAGQVLLDLEGRGLIEAHGKSIVVRDAALKQPEASM